jgi:hypothetical protein
MKSLRGTQPANSLLFQQLEWILNTKLVGNFLVLIKFRLKLVVRLNLILGFQSSPSQKCRSAKIKFSPQNRIVAFSRLMNS